MEAFVQMLCPECAKAWESTPSDLPDLAATFQCPDCQVTRRLSEFMRTERDLETVKRLK